MRRQWRNPVTHLRARRFLAATLDFGDGYDFSATKGTGGYTLLVGCGYRSPEPREGSLEHRTGQGCFWLRHCSPYNDKSTFPPLL